MQTTARKTELPLDKMCLVCEVTHYTSKDDLNAAPKEGANVHGLFLEVNIVLLNTRNIFLHDLVVREPGGTVGRTV